MESKHAEIEGIDRSTYAGKAVFAVQQKLRGVIGGDMVTLTLVDFVKLMLINNKFANAGIFVTEKNKEESYIKIIESGDESLINDLEEFIHLVDQVKKVSEIKSEYQEIVEQLKKLSDYNNEEEVNNLIEKYLRR